MIDARGYLCPTPVMMTKEALEGRPDTLEVLVDARAAVENITRFARSQGYSITETPEGPDYKLTLKK